MRKYERAGKRDRVVKNDVSEISENSDWIETRQLEGRKSVLEALKNDSSIDRILIKKEENGDFLGTLKVISAMAREWGIVVTGTEKTKLDYMARSGNHQGVIALCPAKDYVSVQDILDLAEEKNEPPFIILLDGITDPHNLGAVLRTAECGGVHGVIIPKRRAAGLTGAVARTSAGAVEYVNVAKVTNITRTIDELKKSGIWIYCADNSGNNANNIHEQDFSGSVAIIIGAEGEGVSRLVSEKADFTVSIPMLGKISSLNASVAAGIMIYQVVRCRYIKI